MRPVPKCLVGSNSLQHCVNRSGAGRIGLVDGSGRPVCWECLVTGCFEINNPYWLGRGLNDFTPVLVAVNLYPLQVDKKQKQIT